MSYSQFHKSISRFYAWGFAKLLSDKANHLDLYQSIDELLTSEVPIYEDRLDKNGNLVEPKNKEGLASMWQIAKDDASNASEEEAYLIFGTAIYDMIALEATSHPINYLRKLGMDRTMRVVATMRSPAPSMARMEFCASQVVATLRTTAGTRTRLPS